MSVRLLSLLLALVLGVGCQMAMPRPSARPIDYGPPVWQYEAERLAKDYMWRALIDPRSARYRFGYVYPGFLFDRLEYKSHYGYVLRVHVDAKNRKGEYAGELLYTFLIRDGRIVHKEFPPFYKWPSPSIFSPAIAYILRE